MWEFKPRPKSMALFGLRVPRGNKNWFAHSFVSIEVGVAGEPGPTVAHLLFMPFLFEFPRKSIYNVFIRFVSWSFPPVTTILQPVSRYRVPKKRGKKEKTTPSPVRFGNFQTILLICMFYKLFICRHSKMFAHGRRLDEEAIKGSPPPVSHPSFASRGHVYLTHNRGGEEARRRGGGTATKFNQILY